jgi:hypothetical protein
MGDHIFAPSGDSCPFASGTYTPTVPIPGPPPQPIVGLYADGGSITALPGGAPVTVNATEPSTSYGFYATNGGTIGPLEVAGVTTRLSNPLPSTP